MTYAQVIRAVAVSTALLCVGGNVHAQWKPTKTVDMIVHTGPGGGSDLLARAIATMMEKEKLLPVRMQVLNRAGGNGAVAAAAIAERKDDPHTIGLVTSVWIAGPLTSSEAKITLHDLKPVAGLLMDPAVFAVRADSPYKTLREFIEAAKAQPGQLKQSGGSVTSRDNIIRQSLQAHTGARWAFVSFPGGGERLAALLGGHVDIMVIEPQEAGEQVRAGKMRVLAQLSERPLPGYPVVPTLRKPAMTLRRRRRFVRWWHLPECPMRSLRTGKIYSPNCAQRLRGKSMSRTISSRIISPTEPSLRR